MAGFTITRVMGASVDRVWEILGDPGSPPGPGVEVTVERPGASDGTGLVRNLRIGRGTYREETTSVGPGHRLTYRMLSGAPVRDYIGTVTLEETPGGGSLVHWAIRFQPKVPGTGWLVAALSKRTLNQVLDLVEAQTSAPQPSA